MDARIHRQPLIDGLEVRWRETAPLRPWVVAPRAMPWIANNRPAYDLLDANVGAATPLLWGRNTFQIDSIQEPPGNGWLYELSPWPAGQRAISVIDLSIPALISQEAIARAAADDLRRLRRGWLWEPFVGFLPAVIQDRLSVRLDINPARATTINAYLLMPLAIFICIVNMDDRGISSLPFILALLFFFECAIRVGHVYVSERGVGIFLVEGAFLLAQWGHSRFRRRRNSEGIQRPNE